MNTAAPERITPITAADLVEQLRTEALSMRKPEGEVVAELADKLAVTLHAEKLQRAGITEPYAACLLGLVTSLKRLEERQWFANSIAVTYEVAQQLADVRTALATAKRHLGISA